MFSVVRRSKFTRVSRAIFKQKGKNVDTQVAVINKRLAQAKLAVYVPPVKSHSSGPDATAAKLRGLTQSDIVGLDLE